MTMTIEALIDHLRSVDELEPPSGDGRSASVRARVRRVRRRQAAAVAFVAAAVVAVAFGAVTAARTPESPAQLAAAHGLPTSIKQPDGVVYQISAVATLDTGEDRSISVRVPAPHGIVSIEGVCDATGNQSEFAPTGIEVAAPGSNSEVPLLCGPRVGPYDLDVSTAPVTDGLVELTITNEDWIRPAPVLWYVAFYTWEIPAHLAATPPLPALPAMLTEFTLIHSYSGRLATQHSVTFTIPDGFVWAAVPICGPALRYASQSVAAAPADAVTISVGGTVRVGQSCRIVATSADLGELAIENDMADVTPPVSGTVTISFNFPPAYNLRAADWELGIYASI